jgi:hypothetical protein
MRDETLGYIGIIASSLVLFAVTIFPFMRSSRVPSRVPRDNHAEQMQSIEAQTTARLKEIDKQREENTRQLEASTEQFCEAMRQEHQRFAADYAYELAIGQHMLKDLLAPYNEKYGRN